MNTSRNLVSQMLFADTLTHILLESWKYSSEYLVYDNSFREIKWDKDMINETFGINWRFNGDKLFITDDSLN